VSYWKGCALIVLFAAWPVSASDHGHVDQLAAMRWIASVGPSEARCIPAGYVSQDLFPGPSDPIWVDQASVWVEPLPAPGEPVRCVDCNYIF